jgi:hypothetical protein
MLDPFQSPFFKLQSTLIHESHRLEFSISLVRLAFYRGAFEIKIPGLCLHIGVHHFTALEKIEKLDQNFSSYVFMSFIVVLKVLWMHQEAPMTLFLSCHRQF